MRLVRPGFRALCAQGAAAGGAEVRRAPGWGDGEAVGAAGERLEVPAVEECLDGGPAVDGGEAGGRDGPAASRGGPKDSGAVAGAVFPLGPGRLPWGGGLVGRSDVLPHLGGGAGRVGAGVAGVRIGLRGPAQEARVPGPGLVGAVRAEGARASSGVTPKARDRA